MHDFGQLVYLDLQKTGSSFTCAFLNECCTLEQQKYGQHNVITDDYNPKAFYFISIRHPVSMYSSLYRYGREQSGGMFQRLQKSGKVDIDEIYSSFDAFAAFLLQPVNGPLLDNAFSPEIAGKYGFATYRFLRLSMQRPMVKIDEHLRKNTSARKFKKNFIHSLVIKNESLNDDLYKLAIETKPQFFDPDKVRAFLSSGEKVNSSRMKSSELPDLDDKIMAEVKRKDGLLLEYYA